MLYMSNDRKGIFKTEQECLEYEQKVEQERIKKEKLEKERQDRLDSISKKYKDLQKDISEYKKDYGDTEVDYYISSFEEFARLILGC